MTIVRNLSIGKELMRSFRKDVETTGLGNAGVNIHTEIWGGI